jgi:hypothetical protein
MCVKTTTQIAAVKPVSFQYKEENCGVSDKLSNYGISHLIENASQIGTLIAMKSFSCPCAPSCPHSRILNFCGIAVGAAFIYWRKK